MSDSDESDCAYFGTPLEELDEDDARTRKAQRVEDQIVCDKQGRRRFHGAFTGGFSAGYFNSVGSKDGWAPSTFVSSRNQRADNKSSRPQDFMDDEDLAFHGISPHGIQTTSSFDSREAKKRKRVLDPRGPIPGVPVLEEILRPSKETMGMKLLRHLGWRPGQGIGPRVKRSQKMAAKRDRQKIYGCSRPEDMEDGSDDSDEDESCIPDVTFAPDDTETQYLATPKADHFGLGYKGLDRTPVLGGHINLFDPTPLTLTEKKKKVLIKGQAFGVGAFEEEDEDIYSTEDMSNYDFGDEKNSSPQKPETKSAPSYMTLMGLAETLEGFKLSSGPQGLLFKTYQRPSLPANFIPLHKPRRRRFEPKENEVKGLGRHDLTSEQRAQIIGERSTATVEIRSGVRGEIKEPLPVEPPKTKAIDTSEVDRIFEEFKSSSEKLSTEFKPFAKNEGKQRRYDLYLRMKERGQKDRFHLAQPKSMTEWEKEREIQEFARAALLFRPLTSTMSNRFVSAASTDSGTGLKDGLNVDIPKRETETSKAEIDSLGGDVADDRVKAARMKMFGKLTQSVVDWHPDRLLCRRFNVPHPYPESNFVGVRKTKREKFSIFGILNAPVEDTAGLQSTSSQSQPKTSKGDEDRVKEEVDDEIQEDAPETYGLKVPVDGPPTMDLFKAIFQDSDTDSSSDSDDETPSETPKQKETTTTTTGEDVSREATNASSSVTDERSQSQNNVSDGGTKSVSIASVDNFLTSMRDRKPLPESESNNTKQKVRISRFEPQKDTNTSESESTPHPVFISRKKPNSSSSEVLSNTPKGIFANIDFEELNKYRSTTMANSNTGETQSDSEKLETKKGNADSESSLNSEDEYGPPVPTHLKNRMQTVKSAPSSIALPQIPTTKKLPKGTSGWVVKSSKPKKHKKHKLKDKHKKEKKKKKHRDKKHKKKEKKRRSRSSRSSSSHTDSSDSD